MSCSSFVVLCVYRDGNPQTIECSGALNILTYIFTVKWTKLKFVNFNFKMCVNLTDFQRIPIHNFTYFVLAVPMHGTTEWRSKG